MIDFSNTEKALATLVAYPARAAPRLAVLQNKIIGDCQLCGLCKTRTKLVFGTGNAEADLMIIGEGPGAQEDQQGLPFVGASGQFLTKLLVQAGVRRENVYIANVVKCRPPDNRDPTPEEISACRPFLIGQIKIIQPKVIVTLGKYASQTILNSQEPITKLRGEFGIFVDVPVLPTFHPAYCLRNPKAIPTMREDFMRALEKVS